MSTATKSKTTRKPAIKIEVVEDPAADDKKKGRKPKGAKLVVKPADCAEQQVPLENVILHLKCSSKDLAEYNNRISQMASNVLSYNPDLPPAIMTYNGVNATTNYFVYNDAKTSGAVAAYNPEVCAQVCPKCSGSTEAAQETDDDVSVKDINAKLKKLKLALYKNNLTDKKSACFWCTYDYDSPTCYIPKHESEAGLVVYGSFCRPECAAAYLLKESLDDSVKFERYHLLNQIYGKIYGYKKNIKPSPNPYYLLDKFYGTLSINEYRRLLKTEHMLLTIEKPMTRSLPELYEETDEMILNVGSSKTSNIGSYKVKRQSEKVSGPSKLDIMMSTFGITTN
jgi:hypothetical protein